MKSFEIEGFEEINERFEGKNGDIKEIERKEEIEKREVEKIEIE